MPARTALMIQAARSAYNVKAGGPLPDQFCPALGAASYRGFVATDSRWFYQRWLHRGVPDYRDAVYVAERSEPKELLIVFRGTKPFDLHDPASIRDWINDANADFVTDPDLGRVHEGFLQSLNNLLGSGGLLGYLQEWRKREGNDSTPIHVVGHSKGGAVAVLAGLKLKRQGFPVAGVFTFAAARGGGTEFATIYSNENIPTVRYENQLDLVPHLPPTAGELQIIENATPLRGRIKPKGLYMPVGDLHYVDLDGSVETPRTLQEAERLDVQRLQNFRSAIKQTKPDLLFHQIAEAHNIDSPGAPPDDWTHHRYFHAANL